MADTKRTVTRIRPSLELRHEWRHRNRHDVYGHRAVEVQALFSTNEEPVTDPARVDGHQLPNEIVLRTESGPDRTESVQRLSRAAATELLVMLEDALAWDGVAP